MKHIRQATKADLARIAEIIVFNYRLNFYPIFQNDWFYFYELQVPKLMEKYQNDIEQMWVYDDGVVKAVLHAADHEVKKLFVEPLFQRQSIGSKLLEYAIINLDVHFLWALEKNKKAIRFYQRHGFYFSDEKKLEDGTTEYLVLLKR